jgi:hypothetical protein
MGCSDAYASAGTQPVDTAGAPRADASRNLPRAIVKRRRRGSSGGTGPERKPQPRRHQHRQHRGVRTSQAGEGPPRRWGPARSRPMACKPPSAEDPAPAEETIDEPEPVPDDEPEPIVRPALNCGAHRPAIQGSIQGVRRKTKAPSARRAGSTGTPGQRLHDRLRRPQRSLQRPVEQPGRLPGSHRAAAGRAGSGCPGLQNRVELSRELERSPLPSARWQLTTSVFRLENHVESVPQWPPPL